MKITDCIQRQRENRVRRKRENIELLEPIVNIFIGGFSDDEAGVLTDLLGERIGDSDKVNYCSFGFGSGNSLSINKVRNYGISDVDIPSCYGLGGRKSFIASIEASKELVNVISDYSAEIFNIVARYTYQLKGVIRVNLIFKAEEMQSAAVARMAAALKQSFGIRYTEGVYIDAYCILDQREYSKSQNGNERKALAYLTLSELSRLAANEKTINMAFCLSNYNSMDRLIGDCDDSGIKGLLTAIGLMMILKDGVCAKSGGKNDVFNENVFKESSRRNGEDLFSLGYMHLERIPDAIEYVICKHILEKYRESDGKPDINGALAELEITEAAFEAMGENAAGEPYTARDVLLSMVKNSTVSVSDLSVRPRQDVIRDIYGSNLDLFFELNNRADFKKNLESGLNRRIQDMRLKIEYFYQNGRYTVYDLNRLLTEALKQMGGSLLKFLEAGGSPRKLSEWLHEREKAAGKVDVLKETKEPAVFYKLANDYLSMKCGELKHDAISKIHERLMDELRSLSALYESRVNIVDSAINDLEETISETLEGQSDLQAGNYVKYYSTLTEEIISRNKTSFKDFIQKLNKDICSGSIGEDQFYSSITSYCNDNILADVSFNDEFSEEMLKRLKDFKQMNTPEDIYNMAYNTILENQSYFINVITAGPLNNETCFFVNSSSRFVESINSRILDMKSKNGIKIFYENRFEGIDILFMEGCFGMQRIHGFTTMKEVYDQLQAADQKEQNSEV